MVSKHDYHWTFGDRCHISFPGGGSPIVDTPHVFNTVEGCATISDSNGQLLFYTDGQSLYDPSGTAMNTAAQSLGGTASSTHSAIIVPPAGGGSLYHVFGVADWDKSSQIGPLTYSAISVSGGLSISSGPSDLVGFGPQRSSERLAAISHKDCDKYWVVSLNVEGKKPGVGTIYAMLIDSDAGPSSGKTFSQPYPYDAWAGFCMKFSPDGTLIALASYDTVDILTFDRATGAFGVHSQITNCTADPDRVYGVEFSPNSQYLYFTRIFTGDVNRHRISDLTTPLAATAHIGQWTTNGRADYRLGALQLAPNGKIYGTEISQNTLLEIGDPDSPSPSAVQFNLAAVKSGGGTLKMNTNADAGLPTFTRIAVDCDDRCRNIASEVDKLLNERRSRLVNQMGPCRDETPGQPPEPGVEPPHEPHVEPATDHGLASAAREATLGSHLHPREPGGTLEPIDPREPPTLEDPGGSVPPQEPDKWPQPQQPQASRCAPLTMPPIRPRTSISWGDSECDCIEGDDTEVMHLTVCNPYSNLTLSNLVVNELVVVDGKGNAVPNLPDGSPSIQLVPVGPYCFDDIAPCTCVTREFVLRLRGAPHGAYHIKVRGICFDACFHGDEEDCFQFDVCKD